MKRDVRVIDAGRVEAMTWLVFAVSGLLVLAGAVSVTSGAPMIQLERGWTEVISGTIAVSGGCVVFALGVILTRLEALRDAMARAAIRPEPAFVENGVADPAAAMPAPVDPEASAPAPDSKDDTPVANLVAEPPADEPEANQGFWKRIRRPSEAADTALPEAAGIPDRLAAKESPATTDARPEVQQDPAVAPSSEPRAGEEAAQLGWLDRSLLKGRPAEARAREITRVEPTMRGFDFGKTPEPVAEQGPVETAAHRGEEPAPEAAPAEDGPTVIGRYQAGVASYVLYSDGTIEVETEGGQSHRFNSMDELKVFIAKQDQPGA